MRPRVIPVLLLNEGGLVKTIKFGKQVYIGDPINAIRLFNDMEVDELVLLDISASKCNKDPDFELIKDAVSEAFMPICYGGGVKNLEQMRDLFHLGIEKVALNAALLNDSGLLTAAVEEFGSQSIVASIDIKKTLVGQYKVFNHTKNKSMSFKVLEYIRSVEKQGAGEIFINAVDKDGVMKGYDLEMIKVISEQTSVPLITCGGGASVSDLKSATNAGACAAAAGSMFIFQGKQKGVLINYPSQSMLDKVLS